jgi:hypothetical protein
MDFVIWQITRKSIFSSVVRQIIGWIVDRFSPATSADF